MNKQDAVMNDMNDSFEQVKKAEGIIKYLMSCKAGVPEIKAVEVDQATGKRTNDYIRETLDNTCGMDYLLCYPNNVVWGVASRFQKIEKGRPPFNTFTVRKERESGIMTEYEKRKTAMKNKGEYPFLTMHGYYDEESGEILSLCIAKTDDIFNEIEKGNYYEHNTHYDKIGKALFFCVPWVCLKKEQKKIYERDDPTGQKYYK